jgi:hypothetical protein
MYGRHCLFEDQCKNYESAEDAEYDEDNGSGEYIEYDSSCYWAKSDGECDAVHGFLKRRFKKKKPVKA